MGVVRIQSALPNWVFHIQMKILTFFETFFSRKYYFNVLEYAVHCKLTNVDVHIKKSFTDVKIWINDFVPWEYLAIKLCRDTNMISWEKIHFITYFPIPTIDLYTLTKPLWWKLLSYGLRMGRINSH